MVRVYSARNSIEAQMIAHALEAEGISTTVQGDIANLQLGQPITVWIRDPSEEKRARNIIDEILSEQHTSENEQMVLSMNKPRGTHFWVGLLFGVILGFTIYAAYNRINIQKEKITSWDSNGDGVTDSWVEYSNNQVSKQIFDSNYDGKPDTWHFYRNGLLSFSKADRNCNEKPDSWYYYDPPGNLLKMEYDYDFDEKADYTQFFKDGYPYKYSADNDHDGRIDEWGSIENGNVIERNWSFHNDRIVDKKALYKHGRKISEAYDRNRDGLFDELIYLDNFERVVMVEEKRPNQ